MKIVFPALFTLLAIGAVAAELLDDEVEDMQASPPSRIGAYPSVEQPGPKADRKIPSQIDLQPPRSGSKPLIGNSFGDKRFAELLRSQTELRKELQKAQLQQEAQKQLVSEIDNLIQAQSQFFMQLQKLKAFQLMRLDPFVVRTPQKYENKLVSEVLSAEHKPGSVIILTP